MTYLQFDWLWCGMVVLAIFGLAIYLTLRAILTELKRARADLAMYLEVKANSREEGHEEVHSTQN